MISNFWEKLSPGAKRIVAIGGGALLLVGVVGFFSSDEEKKRSNVREDKIRHVLTDTNTRDVGIDSLSAEIKLMKQDNDRLQKEMKRFKDQVERENGVELKNERVDRDIQRLSEQLEKLSLKNEELEDKLANGIPADAQKSADSSARRQRGDDAGEFESIENMYEKPEDFFRNAPLPEKNITPEGAGTDENGAPVPVRGMTISSISASTEQAEGTDAEAGSEDEAYLPAGSIISGVLINGMDAPTGQGARQDPFPSTIRIQKEAILPNRFRADIRECFMIVSGYGDLSSERAYLRGEALSCIKDSGDVIETRLDSYAVGEDGKAGVRGRLVSKQGQMIARSLMAGFLGGVAEAFDVDAVPTFNLEPMDGRQYQQNEFTNTVLRGAAAKGASSALDRIAQFYIQMAEGIFPVIEVDAGRQVEVIVTKGTSLKVKGKGSKGKGASGSGN